VLVIASVHRVALVDDLGHHGAPVAGGDTDLLATPFRAVEPQPPGGQRDHLLAVVVVAVVALGRAAAVLALLEAVHRQDRRRLGGHGGRAPELRVAFARAAAVGAVKLLAVSGLAVEDAAGFAGARGGCPRLVMLFGFGDVGVEEQDLQESKQH